MSRVADRNLLWGVLALELEFITRDALVDGMTAWAKAKHRSLEDILVERGALAPSRREALAPLVDFHIADHGGDPALSLAALSSIGPAREAIRSVDDPDVQASLGHVGADPYATRYLVNRAAPVAAEAPPSASVRFRRIRPHARGNLGEVFVAHDHELNREVALKEIQEKHADREDSRQRFLIEAEITGGLEHPGIVPVYGLGRYPDGRPFYAMRLIKGDSLAEAIAAFHKVAPAKADPGERSLELRGLLRRFTDVCNAVAYAHARGVLHRDLKPGNIMVGKYGESLVVDWGLARAIGDDHPDAHHHAHADEPSLTPISGSGLPGTVVGSAVGTPAYMPPEQAAGRPDLMGPRSDVYSLGATLYHLLTGRAPFDRGNPADVLRRVGRGDFPPPRSVAPSVPRGLEAICLKAMALRPEARYPSALALAADLDHWLADEPVGALPDGPLDRLARWSRHHRAATLATAATLISLTLAATTAAGLIGRAQRETQKALDAETKALAAQRLATEQKAAALDEANRSRERMRAVFLQARKTVEEIIALIRDDRGLRETSALRPFRATLLKRAIDFSQDFAREYEGQPDLRAEVADAYHQAGYLIQEAGRPIEAEPAYRKTLAAYEALVAERPESVAYREGLAMALNNLGNLQKDTGRPREAERSYSKARDVFERLVAERPEAEGNREGLAMICTNLGRVHDDAGRPDEAERNYIRALELRERLVAERPEVDNYREGLATTSNNLGLLQKSTGRADQAERSFVRSRDQYELLSTRRPEVDAYHEGMAGASVNLGVIQAGSGRVDEAERNYGRARDQFRRLAEERPEVVDFREGLAKACISLGVLQAAMGRADEAEANYVRARDVFERLAAARPDSDDYRDGLAMACINLGNLQIRTGRPGEAEQTYETVRDLYERLVSDRPEHHSYREGLAMAHNNLGTLRRETGRPGEAERSFGQARDQFERLVGDQPRNDSYRQGLASTCNNLGDALKDAGRLEDAERSFARAFELCERLVADRPGVPEFLNDLGRSHSGLGGLREARGASDEARRSYLAAVERQRDAFDKEPRNPFYRASLDLALADLARVERTAGHAAEAARLAAGRRGLWPGNPPGLYNAACDLALCIPLAPAGSADRARYGDLAMETLGQAIDAGWDDFHHTANDPDLVPLRGRPDFPALLASVMDRAFPADPFAPESAAR